MNDNTFMLAPVGVRPSISLKSGFTIFDNNADGSVGNPYIVVTE